MMRMETMLVKFLKIACLGLIFFMLDGVMNRAMAPNSPGPSTPTGLLIAIDKVSLKTGININTPYIDYITTTTCVDVIASSTGIASSSTCNSASSFGNAPVPNATYESVKLVLDGMATYAGIDPCTGEPIDPNDPNATAPIELPNMIAMSDDGVDKVILKYQVPHPVTGIPAGSQRIDAFTVAGPVEFRLVFPASNSVICAADVPPLSAISGTVTALDSPNGLALFQAPDPANDEIFVTNSGIIDSVTIYNREDLNPVPANVPPLRSIRGTSTGLSNPAGIYADPTHHEIGVANSRNDSVTIYDATQGGDLNPLHTIVGSNTGLSKPGGIALYADNSMIVVANGGKNANDVDDSLTFYRRVDVINGNVFPLYTLQGSSTGLHNPCGLYVDTLHNEVGVTNNGNDSVTIYRLDDITMSSDGNAPPVRTIIGPDTGLSIPCGLYVDVDPLHDEIGVTNNGNNTITFYERTVSGNVAPKRTLRGNATGLGGPIGIFRYVDTSVDHVVVVNKTKDSITAYNREEPGVQLKEPPALHISAEQQSLLARYFYTYTGMIDASASQEVPQSLTFDGYTFDWRITDNRIRQKGDATALGLVPPHNTAFTLTDGSVVSVFELDCPVQTAFIMLDLSSNCPPSPLISEPLPAPSGEYTIPAVILKETILDNKLQFTTTALTPSQFPRPMPTLSLALVDHDTITRIDWSYASEMADPSAKPLIFFQQVQITLKQSIGSYLPPCYQQVTGNAQNLVYSSGSLTPDQFKLSGVTPGTWELSDITNPRPNGCEIKLSDVNAIVFTVTDTLENSFIFSWNPT